MITLNIVPPKIRKDLRLIDIITGVKDTIFLLLFGACIIGVSLLVAKLLLQNHFNATINQNYLNLGINKLSFSEIEEFNNDMEIASTLQKDFRAWSNTLLDISNLTSEGIVFQSLKMARDDTVLLRGTANKRQDLVSFKEKLTASELFKPFEIPLELLVKKEDIQFTLQLTLR